MGALLGTQTGREVEIVNTFELNASEPTKTSEPVIDQDFFVSRRDQCMCHLITNHDL